MSHFSFLSFYRYHFLPVSDKHASGIIGSEMNFFNGNQKIRWSDKSQTDIAIRFGLNNINIYMMFAENIILKSNFWSVYQFLVSHFPHRQISEVLQTIKNIFYTDGITHRGIYSIFSRNLLSIYCSIFHCINCELLWVVLQISQ